MSSREPSCGVVRALALCYQAFEQYASEHIRTLRLTPAQFDIIATLGNTPGMNFKELGAHTLITKGTLTGVVDRLQRRGLVERKKCDKDARVTYVRLTPAGERTFARVFPPHVQHMRQVFALVPARELETLRAGLDRLRDEFQRGCAKLEEAA
jgi:DNA-binding MarR family transcriptional regulator